MAFLGYSRGRGAAWVQSAYTAKPAPLWPGRRYDLAQLEKSAMAATGPMPLRMPASSDLRYAFTESLESLAKPRLFTTAGALARHIHGLRGRQTIQLVDDEREPEDGGPAYPIVSIYVLEAGARTALLGHAYVDGGGHERLQIALDAACRPRSARVRLH